MHRPAASAVSFPVSALLAAVALAAALCCAPARAQSADQLKTDFARAVYRTSATQVHDERPQALLRAVVVLRVKLDAQDHWQAEVFRDNSEQPEMTRAALESVARLPAPLDLAPKASALLHDEGLIEVWLFQDDGRFALKTLAKPQRDA